MTRDGVVRIAKSHGEPANCPYVDIVCLSVLVAVLCEFRILDENMTGGIGACQYAVLVIVNVAFAHRQVSPQLQDGRTITIRPFRVCEFDIFYRRIVSRDYPNRSAAEAQASCVDR